MLKPNVETFIGCDGDYENSRIVLFGAPFDSTTSFRIRIKIYAVTVFLTAEIWSYALDVQSLR